MINYILNKRSSKVLPDSVITQEDIRNAKTVLFSVFARYGDGLISIKIIREFMDRYPNKRYFIYVPPQFAPYSKHFLPEAVTVSIFKRNPIDMAKAIYIAHKEQFDIGFNPVGHGSDSEYFASLAKKFAFYKIRNRKDFPQLENIYDRPRVYVGMEAKGWGHAQPKLKSGYENVLICPESTDKYKSMDDDHLAKMIAHIKNYFNTKKIVLAVSPGRERGFKEYEAVILGKGSSRRFLDATQKADLVVAVDAGPMHLADMLGKDTIGVFSITSPEWVMDACSNVFIVRDVDMKGFYCAACEDGSCKKIVCMDRAIERFSPDMPYASDDPEKIDRTKRCPYVLDVNAL